MSELECNEANKPNMVENPPHYTRKGAMECIDEMILIFGKDKVADFCLCNAWKYRYRAFSKNGMEDLQKSDWYIKKYKELMTKAPLKNNLTIEPCYEDLVVSALPYAPK